MATEDAVSAGEADVREEATSCTVAVQRTDENVGNSAMQQSTQVVEPSVEQIGVSAVQPAMGVDDLGNGAKLDVSADEKAQSPIPFDKTQSEEPSPDLSDDEEDNTCLLELATQVREESQPWDSPMEWPPQFCMCLCGCMYKRSR